MAAALAFSTFQLCIAAFSPLSSQVTRSLHVGFLLLLTFLLYPAFKRGDLRRIVWYDWLLAAVGFALAFYHWIFEADLIQRSGDPTTGDLVAGSIMVILVFDAVRRVMGLALPIICACFLLYGLFGEYLPGALAHRPFAFDHVVSQMYLGTEGIYGIPTLVSATYIFLFILFGSFLEHAGMIQLFNNVALGVVGHARGGPAKVAVVSSGFMGMISGSGVANVLTVGQFTIPLIKRFGYSSVFAGARRRAGRRAGAALHRDDLHAAIRAFAMTLGAHIGDLLERHVHDAAIASAHRVEGDDLALRGDATRELARHLGELVFVTSTVALGVDGDVLARLAGLVGDSRRQVLDGLEDHAALADHAARVRTLDLEADLVGRTLAVVRRERDLGIHVHLLEEHVDEVERALGLRIERPVIIVIAVVGGSYCCAWILLGIGHVISLSQTLGRVRTRHRLPKAARTLRPWSGSSYQESPSP